MKTKILMLKWTCTVQRFLAFYFMVIDFNVVLQKLKRIKHNAWWLRKWTKQNIQNLKIDKLATFTEQWIMINDFRIISANIFQFRGTARQQMYILSF